MRKKELRKEREKSVSTGELLLKDDKEQIGLYLLHVIDCTDQNVGPLSYSYQLVFAASPI